MDGKLIVNYLISYFNLNIAISIDKLGLLIIFLSLKSEFNLWLDIYIVYVVYFP